MKNLRVCLILIAIFSLSFLDITAKSTLEQYFPAIQKGNYFLWESNITAINNYQSSDIKGITLETRSEKLIIEDCFETDKLVKINITVYSWRYLNGSLADNCTGLSIYDIPRAEVATTFCIQSRFFNVKNITWSLYSYLEGLSGFFQKNLSFTMLITDGYFVYRDMNRSVLVGLLEGYNSPTEFTHAKYIVDKESGVLLAREFYRLYIEGNNSTIKAQQLQEKEIMILKKTNFFEYCSVPKPVYIILSLGVICLIIVYTLLRRTKNLSSFHSPQ